MKRKLIYEFETVKKQRVYKAKRCREIYNVNIGGASDDEEDINRPLKKMLNSLREEVITNRPFQKIDRSNVPNYIN